jgi:hypothetical protein
LHQTTAKNNNTSTLNPMGLSNAGVIPTEIKLTDDAVSFASALIF